jgi:hypothetical protein
VVAPIGKEPRIPASTGTPQNEITGFLVIVLPPVRGDCRVLLTPTGPQPHGMNKIEDIWVKAFVSTGGKSPLAAMIESNYSSQQL